MDLAVVGGHWVIGIACLPSIFSFLADLAGAEGRVDDWHTQDRMKAFQQDEAAIGTDGAEGGLVCLAVFGWWISPLDMEPVEDQLGQVAPAFHLVLACQSS